MGPIFRIISSRKYRFVIPIPPVLDIPVYFEIFLMPTTLQDELGGQQNVQYLMEMCMFLVYISRDEIQEHMPKTHLECHVLDLEHYRLQRVPMPDLGSPEDLNNFGNYTEASSSPIGTLYTPQ
jgi:hypothetical protein